MFFLIPVGVEYQARRYPVVTFTLMGINVALYLLSLFFFFNYIDDNIEQREWLTFNLGMIPAKQVWWTYFTSMFVHAGFFHLAGNMVYLFLFGSCVEDTLGRWQYAIFYIVGGLVSTATYAIVASMGQESDLPLVGASGAISACIGGFLLLLAKTNINFKYYFLFFFRFFNGEFALPAWIVISCWFLKDIFWAVISYRNPEAGDGVAFAAHVGGTVIGIGMISLWKLLPRRFKEDGDEEVLQPVFIAGSVDPQTLETPTIFLYFDGAQHGPFTSAQISQMLALGSVAADASFWQEGMPEWLHISEFSPM